jgi:hypothetical protein
MSADFKWDDTLKYWLPMWRKLSSMSKSCPTKRYTHTHKNTTMPVSFLSKLFWAHDCTAFISPIAYSSAVLYRTLWNLTLLSGITWPHRTQHSFAKNRHKEHVKVSHARLWADITPEPTRLLHIHCYSTAPPHNAPFYTTDCLPHYLPAQGVSNWSTHCRCVSVEMIHASLQSQQNGQSDLSVKDLGHWPFYRQWIHK